MKQDLIYTKTVPKTPTYLTELNRRVESTDIDLEDKTLNKLLFKSNQPQSLEVQLWKTYNENVIYSEYHSENKVNQGNDYLNPYRLVENISKNKEFILNEKWNKISMVSARVLKITNEFVVCECLINKEDSIYECRQFAKKFLEHISDLEENYYLLIKISEKEGSFRIDIYNGKGLSLEKDFQFKNDWDELKDIEMDKFE